MAKGKLLNPNDVGYDVVPLAGQSNMQGHGSPYDTARIDLSNGRIWQYANTGSYANQLSLATEPLAHHEAYDGLGPGLTFARWYIHTIPENRRILLVPVAHGGTAITNGVPNWAVGTTGSNGLFANAIAQTQAALAAAGANSRVVAVLWHQGESDAIGGATAAQYRTGLDAVIDGFRSQLGIANLPFILGGMLPEAIAGSTAYQTINSVHADTPNRKARTAFFAGPSGRNQSNDGLHYDAPGQRIMGRRFFDALAIARANTTVTPPTVPGQVTGLTVGTVTGSTVALSWTAVTGATSYLVEYRTTGGSSWTSGGTVTTTSATVSGLLTATGYDFRVTASNSAGSGTPSATATATTSSTPALSNTVAPSVTPTTVQTGGVLTTTNGTWSATPDSYTYQWKRAGAAISGATSSTYTVVSGDTSQAISCTVTAVKSGYTSGSATSNTVTPTAGSSYTITDSFTRADSNSTMGTTETGSKTWTYPVGTWGIASNKAYSVSGYGGCTAVIDLGSANFTYEFVFDTIGGDCGGHVRWADTSNWINIANDGNVYKNASGSVNSLGTVTGGAWTAGQTCKVVANGSTLTVYRNGTQVGTFTDSSAGTKVGFRSNQGTDRFDSVGATAA